MCKLIPFNEQIVVHQGLEGQHRRPLMCILELPWSRASESSNANWPWFRRWAHQIIASNYSTINSYHNSHLHLWRSWQICCEYWASSLKLSPTGADEKIKKTHTVWANEPKLSQFTAKWKPTRNLSQLTLTLTQELITMGINRALKSKLCFKPWRKTTLKIDVRVLKPSCSKIAPNQASKSGIRTWYSGSFPQENLVLNPITVHW
jgi:hypothetical protein